MPLEGTDWLAILALAMSGVNSIAAAIVALGKWVPDALKSVLNTTVQDQLARALETHRTDLAKQLSDHQAMTSRAYEKRYEAMLRHHELTSEAFRGVFAYLNPVMYENSKAMEEEKSEAVAAMNAMGTHFANHQPVWPEDLVIAFNAIWDLMEDYMERHRKMTDPLGGCELRDSFNKAAVPVLDQQLEVMQGHLFPTAKSPESKT